MTDSAKLLVGGNIVTAYRHEIDPDILVIEYEDQEWEVSARNLRSDYTPISNRGRELYREMMGKGSW